MKIFYSWQSDKHIPNNLNRSFIEKALLNAAREIRKDDSMEVIPVIDRDTMGISGTPSIPQTILQKIDKSDVFVCDITIVNSSKKYRPTPNPNVLFELGYAVHKLGWERIIMIMNQSFGDVSKLPFDLEKRRTLLYNLSENTNDKIQIRVELEKKIKDALKLIGEKLEVPQESESKIGKIKLPDAKIEVEIKPNIVRFTDGLSEFNLEVKLKNIGDLPITKYRLEVAFPRHFLNQHTSYFLEVAEKRTEEFMFFRINQEHHNNEPLYPDDIRNVFQIGYFFDGERHQIESLNKYLRIKVLIDDIPVRTIEKKMKELIID